MAAIGRSHPKAKVSELHYAALTAATRATDVPCAALTTDSDLSTIHSSCQALGRALGALDVQMNGATRAQLKALKNELDFPYRTVVVGHAHWAGPTTTVLYLRTPGATTNLRRHSRAQSGSSLRLATPTSRSSPAWLGLGLGLGVGVGVGLGLGLGLGLGFPRCWVPHTPGTKYGVSIYLTLARPLALALTLTLTLTP